MEYVDITPFAGEIYAAAVRKAKDALAAEDIAQETFLAVSWIINIATGCGGNIISRSSALQIIHGISRAAMVYRKKPTMKRNGSRCVKRWDIWQKPIGRYWCGFIYTNNLSTESRKN